MRVQVPSPAPIRPTARLGVTEDAVEVVGGGTFGVVDESAWVVCEQDASGLGRVQVLDSNWKVCSQSPQAGAEVPVSDLVTLASVKLAEAC